MYLTWPTIVRRLNIPETIAVTKDRGLNVIQTGLGCLDITSCLSHPTTSFVALSLLLNNC